MNGISMDIQIDGSPAEMIMSLYSPLSAESGRLEDLKSPEEVPARPGPTIMVTEAAPILSAFVSQEEEDGKGRMSEGEMIEPMNEGSKKRD
jgi:hypothetical protein